ncbi:hypothetical protein C0Q70_20596 [Pomacea canaliculata]|uniref:Uncharacterized protein n=1 Tax=Pomacea canaliculata TaxID=400727 RepID=A0A2T7NG39_POMCA|nr:hypothetical protein C0Q70_20596 [Pomacea canaliculata]
MVVVEEDRRRLNIVCLLTGGLQAAAGVASIQTAVHSGDYGMFAGGTGSDGYVPSARLALRNSPDARSIDLSTWQQHSTVLTREGGAVIIT